jgi:hypothetical protein
MAETAYQVLYRDEWIHGFERDQALLRGTVTTQTMSMDRGARQAVFLVATANRDWVTRGANGLIPASVDDLVQSTVTLVEHHDLPQKTRFNIFAGQADQRAIMQVTSRGVINKGIDDEIIAILDTATVEANTTGTASILTKQLVNRATTMLWNGHVHNDGLIFGVVTPAAWAELTDIPAFSSIDYVNSKPIPEGAPSSRGQVRMFDWMGVKWIMHDGLPGAGTADAMCFIWHKSAVGHAYNDIQALSGYDEQQDYSWARTTIYSGALKIQNAGIVGIHHDDTALSA